MRRTTGVRVGIQAVQASAKMWVHASMAAPMPLDAPVTSARLPMRAVVYEQGHRRLARRPCDGLSRRGKGLIKDASAGRRQLHHLHHDLALGAPTVDVGQCFVCVLKWEHFVDDRADGA